MENFFSRIPESMKANYIQLCTAFRKDGGNVWYEYRRFGSDSELYAFIGEAGLTKDWSVVLTRQEVVVDEEYLEKVYYHYRHLLLVDDFLSGIRTIDVKDTRYPAAEEFSLADIRDSKKHWQTTGLHDALRYYFHQQIWKGNTIYGKLITRETEGRIVNIKRYKTTTTTEVEEIGF